MRRYTFCLFILVAVLSSVVSVARAQLQRVGEQSGRLDMDVRFDSDRFPSGLNTVTEPGLPPVAFTQFFVAIPPGGQVRVDISDRDFVDRIGDLPKRNGHQPGLEDLPMASPGDGFFPQSPYEISEPFVFRKTHIVSIKVYRSQVDYARNTRREWVGYRLTVTYPTAAKASSSVDPLVAGLVENTDFAPALPAGASRMAADPHFSLSSSWVKLWVEDRGVYTVTGTDLSALGVPLNSIDDPNSFRLFSRSGRQLELDLTSGTGSYVPGDWMTESDIIVEYGGDGTFDPGDRIIFYAVGVEDYEDQYEIGGDPEKKLEHLHDDENIYYLTWDDNGLPGTPGRMQTIDATPGAGPDVTTFEQRLHIEENQVRQFNSGGDGWFWRVVPTGFGSETVTFPTFNVQDLDPSQPQTFRTIAFANRDFGGDNDHEAEYLLNGAQVAEVQWSSGGTPKVENAPQVKETGTSFLREGSNGFQLRVPRDPLVNPNDKMLFEWYEVRYHRLLNAVGDRLLFQSPETPGDYDYRVAGFSQNNALYLLDVSDPFHPQQLTQFAPDGSNAIRFGSTLGGAHQFFWAGTTGGLQRPNTIRLHFPKDLRNVTTSPHMIIVTAPALAASAQRIKQYRLNNLPLFSSPQVEVVTTTEIYDNFSGGVVDPMAVRNYFKFLYDNYTDGGGAPLLTYVLFLGDANDDFRNYFTSQANLVTTNLNLAPAQLDAYVTDDKYAALDPEDYIGPGRQVIDIATGRLPAGTAQEASFLVDKIIDYEASQEFGLWRNRVIFVADDEVASRNDKETFHIDQSEFIAHAIMKRYLDPVKIYLTEFPAIGGIKPASRLFFLERWNEGAAVINYVGHGSSKQMADEQVFLDTDVPELRNGLRLPIVMAYSCTMGKFASASDKSLAEKLLFKDDGGAIAAFAATELTVVPSNQNFNINVFTNLSPDQPGLGDPLGVSMMKAKVASLSGALGSQRLQENNEKYNLLGDPAMRLLTPTNTIKLATEEIDSLTTGKRQAIRGAVHRNGQVDVNFSGQVRLVIREPDDLSGYEREDGFSIRYRYPGGEIYEGSANVTNGEFEFSVNIPRSARKGPKGYVFAYADNGQVDAAARTDTVEFFPPSAGDSTVLVPIDGEPRVQLGFKGGATKVKPGAVIEASIRDQDGINVLSTTPEGKLALVFDNSNLPLDVTEFFEFDFGGADTSGVLQFPLPDLSVGNHSTVIKVSDSFGQVQLDTLTFAVTDPLDYAAEVVLNYPNPFGVSTHFLLNLTDRADVRMEIFTVTGRRVRTIRATKDPGEAWIFWDGRDFAGDTIANGTYLYVARVEFDGLDRAPLLLRGKVVKIE